MKRKPGESQNLFSRLFGGSEVGRLVLMLVAAYAAMAIIQPHIFLTKNYTVSMIYLLPEYGILSLAMMLAMISGGIDLSIVAVADLAGICSCMLLVSLTPPGASLPVSLAILLLALVAALVIGLVCGALNATLISKVGIPPMLATLGSADLILGLAIALTKGSSVKGLPPVLSDVFNATLFGVLPVTTIVFALAALLVAYLLVKTRYGFKVKMLGSNKVAARYAGIDTDKTTYQTYITSGLLSAMAGVLMCARFNSARSDFGTSYTLQAILVCVLAGVNPNGGFGKVKSIVLAVLILQVLSSGFNMFPDISNFVRNLIWGGVLLLVMMVNHLSAQRRAKKAGTAGG